MDFFDSHSHLNDEKFDEDREKVISEIYKSGVTNFITAGYSLESSIKAVELAKKYKFTFATVGVSPNDIPQNENELWKQFDSLRVLLENKEKIVAVGEIGLDYYWNKENKDMQKMVFVEQIKIANEYNLPIVIHTRDAYVDTIEILKENKVLKKGVFHCCPQNMELIREALDLDFYISFAGPITFKNSKNASEIVSMVPMDRILIETDSPYLAPEPFRGTRNTPANVKLVAQKIADVKGLNLEEVSSITAQNAKNIFDIKY